jgi:DNA repair protein RadC
MLAFSVRACFPFCDGEVRRLSVEGREGGERMYEQMEMTGVKHTQTRKQSGSFKLRVNERIARYGVETITEGELLAVLTDIPGEYLEQELERKGLIELARSIDSLDITDTQKRKLALIFELARKLHASRVKEKDTLDSSSRAGEYFKGLLATRNVEEFMVALLNAQNKLMKTVTAFRGTLSETAVYPREIVKLALLNNAHTVILAHNHPGGSTKPSQADLSTTKNLKAALDTVNVNVLDHIIVSGENYTSFAEQGLL